MNILWIYGLTESSGYARNSREFIKALNANGVTTKFLSLGHSKYPEKAIMGKWEAETGYSYDLVVQNCVPPAFKKFGNKKNILMTVAETDSVSQEWVKCCNTADEVWTMSYYSQAAFIHSGVTVPVRVVLMPIDIQAIQSAGRIKSPEIAEQLNKFRAKCSFIFMANSEWTPRKGWDILLHSFCKVFAPYEDIGLMIKTCCFSGVETSQSMARLVKQIKEQYDAKCPVFIINDVMDIEDVWTLYKFADAFVLPSRGEGCGIPFLEAMSMGLPTVMPSHGGQVDYANDMLCTRVKSYLRPAHRFPHNPNYDETMLWIETDQNELSDKLMSVIMNHNKERNELGRGQFIETFSYDGTAIKDFIKIAEVVIK